MFYIEKESSIVFEEKKSKFISYMFPYKDFEKVMKRLKKEHPKARHFVYAYRYLNELGQIVENSSDDGEPRGTSGKPSLKVLIGKDIIDSGVIIVRYFGGIKLGTGGLVRAYGSAVNLVFEQAELKNYEKLEQKELMIKYSDLSKVEYQLQVLGIAIKAKKFEQNVILVIEGVKEKIEMIQS